MALDGKDCKAIYEALSQRDVQGAADEFRPVYDRPTAKMDMSAWRSIPTWRTTPTARLPKPAVCGLH